MPKVGGLEVLREIRASEDLKRIPVVILTSSRQETDLMRSYDLGVNAYVVKPVEFGEFMEAVKQLGVFWQLSTNHRLRADTNKAFRLQETDYGRRTKPDISLSTFGR